MVALSAADQAPLATPPAWSTPLRKVTKVIELVSLECIRPPPPKDRLPLHAAWLASLQAGDELECRYEDAWWSAHIFSICESPGDRLSAEARSRVLEARAVAEVEEESGAGLGTKADPDKGREVPGRISRTFVDEAMRQKDAGELSHIVEVSGGRYW